MTQSPCLCPVTSRLAHIGPSLYVQLDEGKTYLFLDSSDTP